MNAKFDALEKAELQAASTLTERQIAYRARKVWQYAREHQFSLDSEHHEKKILEIIKDTIRRSSTASDDQISEAMLKAAENVRVKRSERNLKRCKERVARLTKEKAELNQRISEATGMGAKMQALERELRDTQLSLCNAQALLRQYGIKP